MDGSPDHTAHTGKGPAASGACRGPAVRVAGAALSLAAWVSCTAGGFCLVRHYSLNIPFSDEWAVVPYVTRAAPFRPRVLWEQHNEHRLPLPRLMLILLLRTAGMDFRAGAYANLALMSGLSLGMMFAVRRLRGHLRASDAFFPLVLLTPAQAENFLSGWQLQFVLTAAAACGLLVACTFGPGRARTLVAGFCLLALPLCGAQGLVLAAAPAVWLAWQARRDRVAAVFVLAAVAVGVLYFVGLRRIPPPYRWHDPMTFILGVIEFFGLQTGMLPPPWWLASMLAALGVFALILGWGLQGLLWTVAATAVFAIIRTACGPYAPLSPWTWAGIGGAAAVASGAALAVRALRSGPDQASGVLACLAAGISLAIAVSWARSGPRLIHETGRYQTLMLPAWCATYLAAVLYERRGALLRGTLCAIAGLWLIGAVPSGLEVARRHASDLEAMQADVRAGLSPEALADRYVGSGKAILPGESREFFLRCVRWLRDAGHPEFRQVGGP